MKMGGTYMLSDLSWLKYSDDLNIELMESKDEGKSIIGFEDLVKEIKAMEPGAKKEALAGDLFDKLADLSIKEDYNYMEPSDMEAIRSCRPQHNSLFEINKIGLNSNYLYDKIYGAWLGRCAGCLLGQPVEGWQRSRIEKLLKVTDNYPLNHYMSSNVPEDIRQECDITDYPGVYGNEKKGWINNVEYMPEDDDINYTIMGLKIVEKYGVDFTPDHVAECWLDNLPILHLCTAERVAYRNLVNMMFPPQTASYRNPYREWIGAQIRGDFYGYIAPGKPELSSSMAFRDASISHTKNGIYGEMFIAAMLSAAAVTDDIEVIINIGLSMIPEKSRLSQSIKTVMDWHNKGISWEFALDKIHQLFDEKNAHDWCHTISNAMIVCISLLFGGKDFSKSIGIAVMAGFDTDCNGATVGSILGMVLGARAIPEKWIEPLGDKLKSGIDGFNLVEISDLAYRTVQIAKNFL